MDLWQEANQIQVVMVQGWEGVCWGGVGVGHGKVPSTYSTYIFMENLNYSRIIIKYYSLTSPLQNYEL